MSEENKDYVNVRFPDTKSFSSEYRGREFRVYVKRGSPVIVSELSDSSYKFLKGSERDLAIGVLRANGLLPDVTKPVSYRMKG